MRDIIPHDDGVAVAIHPFPHPSQKNPSYTISYHLGAWHSYTGPGIVVYFFFPSAVWSIRTGSQRYFSGGGFVSREKKPHTKEWQERCFSPLPISFLILSKGLFSFFLPRVKKRLASFHPLAKFEFFVSETCLYDIHALSNELWQSLIWWRSKIHQFTFVSWLWSQVFWTGSCRHFCQLSTSVGDNDRRYLPAIGREFHRLSSNCQISQK